jgi:sugar/nucleoside kinase (ribokinase family)
VEATNQPTEDELKIQIDTDGVRSIDEGGSDAEYVDQSDDPEESIADDENEPVVPAEQVVAHDQLEDEEADEATPEAARSKIFVSYNRNDNDKAVAERIYDELSHQHDVFLDYRTIKPGDDYQEVTQHWLDTCDFVIPLISAKSIETSFIKAELERVYERYKRESRPNVIPLRINYAGPSGLRLDAYIGSKPSFGIIKTTSGCSNSSTRD